MNALRTTKTTAVHSSRTLVRVWVGIAVACCLYGCGTDSSPSNESSTGAVPSTMPGANDPNWLTSREQLPPPDTDRIEYDADKRTLILYDLPNRDNWMVQLPDEATGRLVSSIHRLPEGVDTSHTYVYYARAGSKVSAPVSVAQIAAGHIGHTSLPNGN